MLNWLPVQLSRPLKPVARDWFMYCRFIVYKIDQIYIVASRYIISMKILYLRMQNVLAMKVSQSGEKY